MIVCVLYQSNLETQIHRRRKLPKAVFLTSQSHESRWRDLKNCIDNLIENI